MLINQIKTINLPHIFLIVAAGLIQTLPATFYGIFDAFDLITYHLKWSKHFAAQFWSGDLYPRWLLNMNAGLGSPTFFFYPPVPYYFTSLFHPLFTHDSQGWYQLSLAAALALVASGITAYIWLKNITNQQAALIASILYISLPYHAAFGLYWRFAYAEYWSFVWMPLVMYFAQKLIVDHSLTQSKSASAIGNLNIIGFAVSLASLSMTHLPTFIIFFPIPITYILLMTNKQQRKKTLIRLSVATILAVGLSAIYWLPAMTTQEYISMYLIRQGNYFYANNFLFNNHPYLDWRYLEILSVVMGGFVWCIYFKIRTDAVANQREANYWIAIATISLFMTIPPSKPVWDVITVIQRLQFPWRFHTILTLATSVLFALAFSNSQQIWNNLKNYLGGIGVLLATSLLISVIQAFPLIQMRFEWQNQYKNTVVMLFIILMLVLVYAYFQSGNLVFKKNSAIIILLFTSLILSNGILIQMRLVRQYDRAKQVYSEPQSHVSQDAMEYRPKWVGSEIFQPEIMSKLAKISKATVTDGQGSILIQRWKPREIELQVQAQTGVGLRINQFYYPGWTARTKDGVRLLVQPSQPEGLLDVSVPRGNNLVRVTLDAGVEERTGQAISAVSALALFLLLCCLVATVLHRLPFHHPFI